MDIRESLGKIEQYWQIIRNLHFHIEQEGKISPEEYALIDKYLSIISKKYGALIAPDNEGKEELIVQMNHGIQDVKSHEPVQAVSPSQQMVTITETVMELATPTPAGIVLEEVMEETETPQQEVSLEEVQAKPAADNSLSSILQKMLEEPSTIPATPVTVDKTTKKPSTFNERMMESRALNEDINSRIKKTMAETISLNEKFEFIRELFGNNPVDYATALSYIDARSESNLAWMKVESEFADKYKWSTKPGSVDKLKKVVERRYQ